MVDAFVRFRALACAALAAGAALSASAARCEYGVLYACATMVAFADADGDGLSDDSEARLGCDPGVADTDGDGLSDGDEALYRNTSPTDADTDGDGYPDGLEAECGTDPLDPSSFPADADGNDLPDDWEREFFGGTGVDPEADPDSDGLSNVEECLLGTDPLEYDTDMDGMGDGNEVYYGHDPLVRFEPPLSIIRGYFGANGMFNIEWTTMYGLGYIPQYKDSLLSGEWKDMQRRVIYEGNEYPGGTESVIDFEAPLNPMRFYRVITTDE